jgi:hypothetical protein
MMRAMLRRVLLASALATGAALAQAPSPVPGAPTAEELRQLCAAVPASPVAAADMARRAECILSGVLPSAQRIAEARALARAALQGGEPAGGLVLYLVFAADPSNQAGRDGRMEPETYRRLGARALAERAEQVEAIEGLGFAAGRNHPAAGMLLANYFHDTVAPRNVARTGAMADVLMRSGQKHPALDRYIREANAIARTAPATKASPRSFLEAYAIAVATAQGGYRAQGGSKACADVRLKSVSSGDIEGAEFLPLKGTLVADSYLVKGRWSEFWIFQACDQEVPVKVHFEADGWGGSVATASHNKGE